MDSMVSLRCFPLPFESIKSFFYNSNPQSKKQKIVSLPLELDQQSNNLPKSWCLYYILDDKKKKEIIKLKLSKLWNRQFMIPNVRPFLLY